MKGMKKMIKVIYYIDLKVMYRYRRIYCLSYIYYF